MGAVHIFRPLAPALARPWPGNPYPVDTAEHRAFDQAMEDIDHYRAAGDPDAIEALADGLEAHPFAHDEGFEAAQLEAVELRRAAARLRSGEGVD